MSQPVTVSKAIFIGLAVVNGLVLLLVCGPLLLFGRLVEREVIPRSHNWAGLLVFALGLALAWLWWSLSVPRWRLWAYERVRDITALKRNAVAVGLTWPDDHPFGKTEIKSRAHARREREFDRTDTRDDEA